MSKPIAKHRDPDSALERGRAAFIALANRLNPDNKTLRNAELVLIQNFGAGLEVGLGLDAALILAANAPPHVDVVEKPRSQPERRPRGKQSSD